MNDKNKLILSMGIIFVVSCITMLFIYESIQDFFSDDWHEGVITQKYTHDKYMGWGGTEMHYYFVIDGSEELDVGRMDYHLYNIGDIYKWST